jgi:hypothetical protein
LGDTFDYQIDVDNGLRIALDDFTYKESLPLLLLPAFFFAFLGWTSTCWSKIWNTFWSEGLFIREEFGDVHHVQSNLKQTK